MHVQTHRQKVYSLTLSGSLSLTHTFRHTSQQIVSIFISLLIAPCPTVHTKLSHVIGCHLSSLAALHHLTLSLILLFSPSLPLPLISLHPILVVTLASCAIVAKTMLPFSASAGGLNCSRAESQGCVYTEAAERRMSEEQRRGSHSGRVDVGGREGNKQEGKRKRGIQTERKCLRGYF